MAPKKDPKKDQQAAALPTIEDEVQLPEGVAAEDPPFACAVAHVLSHSFTVEGRPAEDGSAALQDFDPCAALLARLREEGLEDPLARQVVPVEREELLPLAEGGPLARGLRRKIERESGARRRRKVNAARTRAIAEAQGEAPPGPPAAAPRVDLVLALVGFPAGEEELAEAVQEGLFDLPEAWVSVYLAGASLQEEPAEGAEAEGAPRRALRPCEPPEVVPRLHAAICGAELGSGLANSTLCTLPDSHLLAAEAEAPEAVRAAVVGAARTQAERRLDFDAWVRGARTVSVPELQRGARADARLYGQLADCIPPAHQDVPALLGCLCEQVAFSLGGDGAAAAAAGPPAAAASAGPGGGAAGGDAAGRGALQLAEAYLNEAHDRIALGDVYATALDAAQVAAGGAAASGPAAAAAAAAAGAAAPAHPPPTSHPRAQQSGMLVLPYADHHARLHANDELPGGISVAGAAKQILSHLRAPGTRRAGFPVEAPLSAAQRSAMRNRIYSFLPEISVAKIDQMLLLQEFEHLLESKQPERRWHLERWLVRERVPAALFAQAFLEATRQAGFVDTEYVPQRDCLLVALHHRALPGHVLWHSWEGDLSRLADAADAPGEGAPLCPVPSFNDWWHMVAKRAAEDAQPGARAAPAVPAPTRFLGQDARDIGYCRVVEKLLLPSDGSVISRTTFQRGLAESLPGPSAADGAGFVPPPRSELQSARLITGSAVLGMVSDAAWAAKAEGLRRRREEQREAEARAAAAEAEGGAGAAAPAEAEAEEGGAAEDGAATPEAPAPRAVTERRLEDLRFGSLWVAFRGGARCTVRMHHERPWFAEGEALYDVALARPGVLLTFVPASGCAVQVLSDGSVHQTWPARPAVAGPAATHGAPCGGLVPGGAQDLEVARTIMPLGAVVRSLLSGRREVYHPDGTRAVRNPTLPEMRLQRERCGGSAGGPLLKLLESLLATAAPAHRELRARLPTMQEKAAGLPGHWRVTRPDGRCFGRMSLSPEAPREEPADPADAGPAGDAGAEDPAAPLGLAGGFAPTAELLERMDGVLVDGGAVMEYEIDPISVSSLTDPHTGQSASSNAEGLLMVEEARADARVCLLPDDMRVSTRRHEEGYSVTVEREGAAHVTCRVAAQAAVPGVLVTVSCDDGTRLEVTPRRLNHKGELVPSDPGASGAQGRFCTNASVLLVRPDGTAVLSRGSGEVDVLGGVAPGAGEAEVLRAAGERGGACAAQLDGDTLLVKDGEGNAFEARGDQSVGFKLAVSMGDDFPSPRCAQPGRPYGHPDAKYLPLPEDAPPPRLFVVNHTGDAEELLSVREAEEALRLAAADPRAVVLRDEPLGQPLEGCRCHSVLRPGPAPQAAAAPLQLPPSIAGLRGAAEAQRPRCSFTELRTFVEYPPISEEQSAAFREAQARHARWEREWSASRAAYGGRRPSGCPPPTPPGEAAEGGA